MTIYKPAIINKNQRWYSPLIKLKIKSLIEKLLSGFVGIFLNSAYRKDQKINEVRICKMFFEYRFLIPLSFSGESINIPEIITKTGTTKRKMLSIQANAAQLPVFTGM